VSENLLLARRTAPQPRAVHHTVTLPPAPTPSTIPALPARPGFAPRNSPIDLLFRALWQLVGVYVFLVLLVKDRRLPR